MFLACGQQGKCNSCHANKKCTFKPGLLTYDVFYREISFMNKHELQVFKAHGGPQLMGNNGLNEWESCISHIEYPDRMTKVSSVLEEVGSCMMELPRPPSSLPSFSSSSLSLELLYKAARYLIYAVLKLTPLSLPT